MPDSSAAGLPPGSEPELAEGELPPVGLAAAGIAAVAGTAAAVGTAAAGAGTAAAAGQLVAASWDQSCLAS